MVVLTALFLCLLALQLTRYFLFEYPCTRLVNPARRPEVQAALRQWVASNLDVARLLEREIETGDGIVPGLRWVDKRLDRDLLGVGERVHIRLIGPTAGDLLADSVREQVVAVSFAERSRVALVVRAPGSSTFGMHSRDRVWLLAEDIAVLCAIGG